MEENSRRGRIFFLLNFFEENQRNTGRISKFQENTEEEVETFKLLKSERFNLTLTDEGCFLLFVSLIHVRSMLA